MRGSFGTLVDFSIRVIIRDSSVFVSPQIDGTCVALDGVREDCLVCHRLIHSIEGIDTYFDGGPFGNMEIVNAPVGVVENDTVYHFSYEAFLACTRTVSYVLDGGEVGFEETADV